jgi:beta-fructofuranosidase
MLMLEDKWVWDSWIADDGEKYHLFFLEAPRSLGDATQRHTAARIAHASSADLVTWDYHGEVFAPSDMGFDDLAIWTGSVVHDGARWRLFYSALSQRGHATYDQRIGMALSDELGRWRRGSNQPIAPVDPRWYKTLATHPGPTTGPDPEGSSETWRDPFVLRDPGGNGWHMLITARALDGARHDDGVVGHAWSADLEEWEVRPPLSRPGAGFGQLEVIRSVLVDGRPVLTFSCHEHEMTEERRGLAQGCSTWSVPAESLAGPFDVSRARPFTADPLLYAAPIVTLRDGTSAILGFHLDVTDEGPGLEISDPIPVAVDAEGYLVAR